VTAPARADLAGITERALRAQAGYQPRPAPAPEGPDPAAAGGLSPIIVQQARRIDAAIPRRYANAVPRLPETDDWLAGAPDGAGLLLAGPTGTGKTHEAYGAVRAWAAAVTAPSGVVVFGNVADLLDRARPGGDLTVPGIAAADLLLLDDLGAFKASEWTAEALYRIVDKRWAECLPTLVTTNMPPADLAAWVGDRLASRLTATMTVVAMTGKDLRRAGR
jgi:DNA replication protein DnaC